MIRLSGTLANRPSATSAVNARYYATDEEQVFFSTGTEWVPKNALDETEAEGQIGGATIDDRPDASDSIGYVWTDAATGNQYEAFPGAWALINDLTPSANPAIPIWVKYSVTAAAINAGEDFGPGDLLRIPITVLDPMTFLHSTVIRPTAFFDGPGYVAGEMLMNVGHQNNGTDFAGSIYGSLVGFMDGPGIEDDPSYIETTDEGNGWLLFFKAPTTIMFYLHNDLYDEASDFQDLVTGGFDLWLLLSKLP